jgi:hypothetical protein
MFDLLDGQDVRDLPDSSLLTLDSIATKGQGYSMGIAQNILELYDYYFPPETCQGSAGFRRSEAIETYLEGQAQILKAYPNPARDYVIFERSSTAAERMYLTIFDARGREVASQTLAPGQLQWIWENDRLSSGIYFYQARAENGVLVHSGRLILQQ